MMGLPDMLERNGSPQCPTKRQLQDDNDVKQIPIVKND